MSAILGRKVGMTQVYSEDGKVVPVTVIVAGPCPIVGLRTLERHGYEAVQIAYGELREKLVSKPVAGLFKKVNVTPRRMITEIPPFDGAEVGQEVRVDRFPIGTMVDVVGTSKGRGFAGVVRRHHFSGGNMTHGVKTKKDPGSIGASAYPSRVIKGKRLPGHMGAKRITVKNLKVVGISPEENLIWVRGSVPGASNGYVLIREVRAAGKGGK